jgi:hypothetical protein
MFFRAFSSVVRQKPGYNSQDGARPAHPNFPFSVLFSYLCIMRTVCVLKCDVLLPPSVNPTAVKYIYHNISLVLSVAVLNIRLHRLPWSCCVCLWFTCVCTLLLFVLYFWLCFTSVCALLLFVLYFCLCFTSVCDLFLIVLYLFVLYFCLCFNSVCALLLFELYFCLCFTYVCVLLLFVLYFCLVFFCLCFISVSAVLLFCALLLFVFYSCLCFTSVCFFNVPISMKISKNYWQASR